MTSLVLFFAFILFGTSFAACKFKFIHNASELIEFSNEVNGGTYYEGYIVYLVADITFNETLSQQYNPITGFSGTFDGQGYVINSLTIVSPSLQHVGLFGNSYGMTIKNVIMDSSCTITSTSTISFSYGPYLGGITGACHPDEGQCIIENSINMANVGFSGSTSRYIYVGGIIGAVGIGYYNLVITITNCVNYGNIYNYGSSGYSILVGGIAGHFYSIVDTYLDYIYNCINYGSVTNTASTRDCYGVGGIIGNSYGTTVMNCVNVGTVTSNRGAGAIVGSSNSYTTTVVSCYWTGCSNYYGIKYSGISAPSAYPITSLSTAYATNLNSNSATYGWSKWVYRENTAKITFVVHDGKGFSHSKQLVLLPEPARRGYAFLFWCVNQNSTDNCKNKYVHSDSGFTSASTLYAQWVVTNCSVDFDVNGGYELPEDERNRTVVFDQEIGELPNTARRGYTFTGWYTVYGELFTNEPLVNNACNCSLIAHWNPNNYTVILDVNRGNKLDNNRLTVTFDSKYGTIPSPTRDGFDFSGWFTKDDKQITSSTVVNITSTQALYAHWGPKKYTVILDVNGGDKLTGYGNGVRVPADAAYDLLPIPKRRGYSFTGWYTEDGGLITNDTATTAVVTKDQTILYAHWRANNYAVAFDVNGGDELSEDEVKNKTITFNTTYDYLPTPSRTGYTFDGWVTENNEIITNITTVNFAYDHTLYAWWTANKYNIEFDPCGGDGLTIITVTFNSSYDCLPTPSREGYTFLWWYIKRTNEIVYNTTTVLTACDHTLCAVWNKNTIIFDVNGGDELDNGKMEVIYEGTYRTLPTPTRTGYTFDGWYTDDGVRIESGSTVKISSGQTLHAKWIPNKYTMPLNPNGGKVTDPSVTVTYNDYYGTLPTPTRTGYTFIGWVTENGEIITINTIVTDPCHCVLSAGWAVNTYIINFVTNGGDELNQNEVRMEVEYDGVYGTLPTPTRKGYTFSGWFNEDGKEIKTGMKVDVADNQTFTAEWTPNEYVVEFNPNGCGEIIEEEEKDMEEEKEEMKEIKEIEVTYDAPYDSLPTPTTKAGYEFDGWFTEDGILITGETKVEIADDHALCAEWTPSNYTVTFDVNGGDELTDDEKEMRITYGGTYKDLPTPTWKGHKFAGWFNEEGAKEITNGAMVDTTEDQTLYARWEEIPSNQITIVIGEKDLSEEEIRKILGIFTDAEFTIESIETNGAGETIVIIRFDDYTKAEELLKAIMESSDETRKFIRVAYSSSKAEASLSTVIHPIISFNSLLT